MPHNLNIFPAILPDLESVPDMINVACLLAFLELGALYEADFYTNDGVSLEFARRIKHARRMARHFALCWDQQYAFSSSTKLVTIVQQLTVQFAAAFLQELSTGVELEIDAAHPGLDPTGALEGISRHFQSPMFGKSMMPSFEQSIAAEGSRSYRYPGHRGGHITKKARPRKLVLLGTSVLALLLFLRCFSLLTNYVAEVAAVTINDICLSCLWTPDDEDLDFVKAEHGAKRKMKN